MSTNSAIEWTDTTWNPVAGCTWASPGCDHCYAARMTRRLEAMGREDYAGLTSAKHFNGKVRTLDHKIAEPLHWKEPRRVFVNSMSDLFHADVPDEFIADVWRTMVKAHRHTYQVLTKRPARAAAIMPKLIRMFGPFEHILVGASIENADAAEKRFPSLKALDNLHVPTFVSYEPALGPIEWRRAMYVPVPRGCPRCGRKHIEDGFAGDEGQGQFWMCRSADCGHQWTVAPSPCFDWLIAGGESGPGARPSHPDWHRAARDFCQQHGVPFFFKQWGGVNKKKAGRLLDGREWNEMPNPLPIESARDRMLAQPAPA